MFLPCVALCVVKGFFLGLTSKSVRITFHFQRDVFPSVDDFFCTCTSFDVLEVSVPRALSFFCWHFGQMALVQPPSTSCTTSKRSCVVLEWKNRSNLTWDARTKFVVGAERARWESLLDRESMDPKIGQFSEGAVTLVADYRKPRSRCSSLLFGSGAMYLGFPQIIRTVFCGFLRVKRRVILENTVVIRSLFSWPFSRSTWSVLLERIFKQCAMSREVRLFREGGVCGCMWM